jgi:hypothetical protein
MESGFGDVVRATLVMRYVAALAVISFVIALALRYLQRSHQTVRVGPAAQEQRAAGKSRERCQSGSRGGVETGARTSRVRLIQMLWLAPSRSISQPCWAR